ncbi:helix-turn-helix transcriptional regulator [Chitinibacter fontanus]|uniref:Helix-turn-helix transcriptional regulator n=1 Tax=Chitinibacter fontanus TaxID=1737446 RepID=A0A7D5ZFH1_9NEIS|nr:helix-turn-helix transcriptional regulator [Chitinibacter fontanus]QLI82646.1 helix-turn-helix transcriptional regulator [Chitinibacter fontanus]
MNQFDQLRQNLGTNVKAVRKERKRSQEQLAFDADIDRTYVSQIERGVSNPSLQVLCKIAESLDTDVLSLLASPPEEASAR